MKVLGNLSVDKDTNAKYPLGSNIQNETDTLNGTPVVREIYGDILMNLYRILELTNITPTDTEDNKDTQFQLVEALKKLPNSLNDIEQVLTLSGSVWSVPFDLSILPNKYFFIARASENFVDGTTYTFKGTGAIELPFTSSGFNGSDELLIIIDNSTVRAYSLNLDNKADLIDGKVPADQLPSYVDDVLEYAGLDAFPDPGETSKIYVALDTNNVYRWSGSNYIEISNQNALWGYIGGDIANQTDLIALINSTVKYPLLKLGSGFILSNVKIVSTTQNSPRNNIELDLMPFVPEYNFTSSNLIFNIGSGTAGANCRIVVYSHNPLTGLPKDKIFESADQSVSGTGTRLISWINNFEVGKAYWLGIVCSSNTPTFTSVPGASQNIIGIDTTSGFQTYTQISKVITSYNNTPLDFGTTHTKKTNPFPIIGIQIQ